VAKDAPLGAKALRLKFDVDAPATDKQCETLLRHAVNPGNPGAL
jgi:hypothetical protein